MPSSWLNNFPIRGRKDYPVLFDRNNQPKSVVDEMIKMAKKYKSKKMKKLIRIASDNRNYYRKQ